MSASHWPDWLRLDPQKNFPTAFRLIISAITGAGLALSFTWLYFPVYAWVSIGLLLMMVLGAKPRVAYFCGFSHAMVDCEPHRASKCGASVHSSTICVGHIGIRTRTSAGNRFSLESARIFRGGESGVAANNYGQRNLWLVVRNGRV